MVDDRRPAKGRAELRVAHRRTRDKREADRGAQEAFLAQLQRNKGAHVCWLISAPTAWARRVELAMGRAG